MFYFGVDYYPEQWPAQRWPVDAQLMSEAGFNIVRLAEFAWSRIEPEEGRFDFDWLDRAIEILHSKDIQVVLGTPTASPPAWLMSKSAALFRVRADGIQVTYGNRREYCPNQPLYQEYTQHIVEKMADHYANHPALIGWQIDNEFGERCYCPACAQKFQSWLGKRYGSLDELNQKWGTVFWSHNYNDWSEIPLPLAIGGSPNPGLALDFYRFSSDSYVAYQQMQIDILREKCPNHFITHNLMGFRYDQLNYFDLARNLDLVAWDNYPRTQWAIEAGPDPSQNALGHAAMRALKRRNFWVMEQQAGQGGWEVLSVAPRPGELRLWAYQSIAHGADAILFFRWRSARFGTEQFWQGLLDHDGSISRRYEEIKQMGTEIKRAGDQIGGSEVRSPIAMMSSYDSRFAFQIQPNNPCFNYADHFHQIYRSFYKRHISVDLVAPEADLSQYKIIIVPALYLMPESVAVNLKTFVKTGGILVVTQRTGVKDDSNAVVNQRLPGLISDICGVEIDEVDSLSSVMHNSLEFLLPELAVSKNPTVSTLCEILAPTEASVVARYTQDYYAGKPAITLNQCGKGRVVYIGAVGDDQLYDVLSNWLLSSAGVRPILDVPEGIEVTERWQGDRRILFMLNHDEGERRIILENQFINLLDGPLVKGAVSIAPRDVLILQEDQH